MEQPRENKMGIMPMNKLLLSMSMPIMISMLVQALYNIVDSIFVAQYSSKGLTAVSLAFPIQSLMIAVAIGTSVGMNSLLSRRLGEKRFDDANYAARNGLFLCAVSAVAFAVFGVICSGFFFHAFTKDAQTIEMGKQYLIICTTLSFGMFLQICGERILQSTGNSFYSMITQGAGAIINIILDPIFIFGYFGCPQMGTAGAALATVLGQITAMALAFWFNHKKNHEISISFKKFFPNGRIIKEIYAVGFPSIIMQSIVSVMTVGINKILGSDIAVSVFGIYFKLQSFIYMPVFGLTNGLIPIVGYNYGARKKERIIHAAKLAFIWAVSIMLVGTVIFQIFPTVLLTMFNAEDALISMGVVALRIISLSFVFAGFSIVCSSIFQALGNGFLSLIMSVVRQLVVILPVAFLLNRLIGTNGVWFAFPIAELVAVVMCILMFRHVYKNKIKVL